MLILIAQSIFIACGGDDDSSGPSNEQVTIGDDGKASNGSVFSSIDDKNFYLDYIMYTVKDGHLVVSGYDKVGFKGVAKIVFGIKYKGNSYEVLEIGSDAFRGCSILNSFTFSNSIKKINFRAFDHCTNLTSINLSNSLTNIGYGAFDGCTSLKNIIIPNSVTDIEEHAFSNTGLTSIIIPNSVTNIESLAFANCSNLTSVNVSNDNKTYDSRNNCNAIIETSSNSLIVGCSTTIIPESVTAIGVHAFCGSTKLTSIVIPNSVSSIGYAAFVSCSSLSSITIPSSVSYLGYGAFYDCLGLTSIHCKSTIPIVMLKLIEKLIIQVGISINRISINVNTNPATKISLIDFVPGAPITYPLELLSIFQFVFLTLRQ